MDALLDTKEISAVTTIMDIDPLAAPTVRRNPSIKRLLKFPWGGQHQGQGKHLLNMRSGFKVCFETVCVYDLTFVFKMYVRSTDVKVKCCGPSNNDGNTENDLLN